jgi:hypothetical protein
MECPVNSGTALAALINNSGITEPTDEQIELEHAIQISGWNAESYYRNRESAYINNIGDWPDQLDLIFHSGIDAWKTEIQKIKDEYPKPS